MYPELEIALKWSDNSYVFYFLLHIPNQTGMFPVHNQLMFCISFTISNVQHLTLHSKLVYLFSLCVHKNYFAKTLLSGTFKLHGEVKRIIIYQEQLQRV